MFPSKNITSRQKSRQTKTKRISSTVDNSSSQMQLLPNLLRLCLTLNLTSTWFLLRSHFRPSSPVLSQLPAPAETTKSFLTTRPSSTHHRGLQRCFFLMANGLLSVSALVRSSPVSRRKVTVHWTFGLVNSPHPCWCPLYCTSCPTSSSFLPALWSSTVSSVIPWAMPGRHLLPLRTPTFLLNIVRTVAATRPRHHRSQVPSSHVPPSFSPCSHAPCLSGLVWIVSHRRAGCVLNPYFRRIPFVSHGWFPGLLLRRTRLSLSHRSLSLTVSSSLISLGPLRRPRSSSCRTSHPHPIN